MPFAEGLRSMEGFQITLQYVFTEGLHLSQYFITHPLPSSMERFAESGMI